MSFVMFLWVIRGGPSLAVEIKAQDNHHAQPQMKISATRESRVDVYFTRLSSRFRGDCLRGDLNSVTALFWTTAANLVWRGFDE